MNGTIQFAEKLGILLGILRDVGTPDIPGLRGWDSPSLAWGFAALWAMLPVGAGDYARFMLLCSSSASVNGFFLV